MKKIIFFVFFLPVFAYASKYSDFVDALYYEKIGDYKKSFDLINKIAQKDNDVYLYKYLYNIASKASMSNELKNLSARIVEIDSTTADNWVIYGNTLAGEGRKDEAIKAYNKAIELDPENIDAYYQLAVLSSDNINEAERYFKKIIEIDPSFKTDSYYNIAVLYSLKKDEKKMKENIELSIKADPYNLKPYYFLAMYYEEKGNKDLAISSYKRLLDIEPTADVSNRIAELYLSIKDYDKANEYFLKTLEDYPDNSKALWWLSLINENKKDYKKAREYLSRIKNWEEDVDSVLKMSYFSIMDGDMASAVGILKNANKKWPGNPEIAYYLALGLMDQQNKENDKEIKSLFEMVVSSNPDNYEARYNLSVVCERLNDVDCFEKNFRDLLKRNPNDHSVLNYLGYSLIDRGLKLDEAISMVEKAVSLDSENSAYLDSLAWGYYKKGDYQKAIEYMEKSINYLFKYNREKDPLMYEHYADILVKLGNYPKAYDNYKEAVLNGASPSVNLKAMSIIKDVDPYYLLAQTPFSIPEFKTNYEFILEFNSSYRKLLKRKNIKFSFNALMQSVLDEKYLSISVLGPLYTPVLSLDLYKDKYNFKSEISDERISNVDIEGYSVLICSLIRWYIQSAYYADFKGKLKNIKYMDKFYVYENVFKKGDRIKMSMKSNPFSFDYIEYICDDTEFIVNLSDFKVVKPGYSGSFVYYIPHSFEFKFDKTSIKLNIEKIDIKTP